MSPEEQRIAIAGVCGYYQFVTYMGDIWGRFGLLGQEIVPDYLNDLNAMHEAEKVLDVEQSEEYMKRLQAITFPENGDWGFCHATAAQRAEAFLKTLNLWKDSP